MEREEVKNQKQEIAIALMQKDIEYIKKSTQDMTTALTLMDRDFARRNEVSQLHDILKKMNESLDSKATHEDIRTIKKLLDTKVDNVEFKPIQAMLSRINWLLVSTVIMAVLGFLYKVGSN